MKSAKMLLRLTQHNFENKEGLWDLGHSMPKINIFTTFASLFINNAIFCRLVDEDLEVVCSPT